MMTEATVHQELEILTARMRNVAELLHRPEKAG